MRFSARLTAAILLLLCLTLSGGGAYTVCRNFSSALEQAAAQQAAAQLPERFRLEAALAAAGGGASGMAGAAAGYARQLRAAGGPNAVPFALLSDTGMSLYSNLPLSLPFAEVWRAVQAGEAGGCLAKAGETPYLLLASPLALEGQTLWLVSGRDLSGLFAERDRQLRQYLALECAALLLAGAAAAALSRLLTRPLRQLEAASRRIAAGEEGARCPQTLEQAGGEVGALAASFNAMAAAVQAQAAALRAENERQKQFVADFTHELKTPMTAILGYADLLRSGEQPPARRQRAAGHIYHEAARLEGLGRQLLLLLGLEEGGVPLEPVPLAAVLADALRGLPLPGSPVQFLAGDAPADACGPAPAAPNGPKAGAPMPSRAVVQGDRVLLAALLRNLLLNAAASGPADGCVRVYCDALPAAAARAAAEQGAAAPRTEADAALLAAGQALPCAAAPQAEPAAQDAPDAAQGGQPGWLVSVTDTGCGIPPGALARVFEPFYRVDKSRSRQNGGTGLGLALCARIAAAHGGLLWLESAPGRGTAARLWLPAGPQTQGGGAE